jgi:lipid-A-disaccharide synthase
VNPEASVRIGIVAGEASGDVLGADLMRALKARLPDIRFEGIGGPLMQAEGCHSLYPMEVLSIIGIAELFGSLFRILAIRRALLRRFGNNPPGLFIGIDAPDFNLGLEARLRARGIKTVHYVSPTIWAWRPGRIKQIATAVDHMLALFPFEEEIYRARGIPVTVVGHPLANELAALPDLDEVRASLGLPQDKVLVGLLPGSRRSELKRHADLFIRTAAWLHARNSKLEFIVSFIDDATRQQFQTAIAENRAGRLPIHVFTGQSRQLMVAADLILLASGTAALEAAMLGRPMVVTYRVNWLTYLLVRAISDIKYVSMPNNLAGKMLVPELLQRAATPETLGQELERLLAHPDQAAELRQALRALTAPLKQNSGERAADVVMSLLSRRGAEEGSPEPN